MRRLSMELYLKNLRQRYISSSKKDKTLILDEFCNTSGCHRKHAIRLLNRPSRPRKASKKSETRGRKRRYEADNLLQPLKCIWLATDQMCSKRLKAALPIWLPHYEPLYGKLESSARQQLLDMSVSTIDRMLQQVRIQSPKGLSGTKPGSLLRKQIPVKTDQWDEAQPGFVEADLVAHCGTTLRGDFVWSLTLTDIYSGWTENRAVWNKGATNIVNQIRDIEQSIPFLILGFDCDNGTEFLNQYLVRYFVERTSPVQFTRSRPYHKDDNAHVEQKNWTHVRQLFGYHRLEHQSLVNQMNEIYRNECTLLRNYFHPAMKLAEKHRVKSKTIKVHHKPQTPYQRLMSSEDVSDEQKDKLKNIFESLNPFELKDGLEKKLKKIFMKVNLHQRGRNVGI